MPNKKSYDVIIVGAGPAGLFAALELCRGGNLKILLLEKGKDLPDRSHKISVLCGWGGAGAYSDGKLNLSPGIGGTLQNIVGQQTLERLIQEVDDTYVRFGASNNVYGGDVDRILEFQRAASRADLRLISTRIRHIGTEVCLEVLGNMREELLGKIEFRAETAAEKITVKNGAAAGVELSNGEQLSAKYVIVAPGREGAEWLVGEARRLGVVGVTNPVDIGVRVEVPAAVMAPITDVMYESKFIYATKSFDDTVRTFCMCPRGEVVIEQNNGLTTVNGHSYSSHHTENTNFAVLVSTRFTKPFDQPIEYGKYIATLANMLGSGVIVQRLGDLRAGRRSTPKRIEKSSLEPTLKEATPGDLSFVLPYRYLTDILEMMEALDRVAPGVNSRFTLLYAVGDGAGITRGLVQASVAGIISARAIMEKIKK